MKSLSIVIPAYNEEKTIEINIARLFEQLNADGLSPNVILVDDGSKDGTWGKLTAIAARYPGVCCVKLSRNFGKESAVFAGMAQVTTDRCLIMDSDMQHPPAMIPELIRQMDEAGADIVEGVKESRGKEPFFYRAFAKSFYKLLHMLCGIDLQNSSDFKLLDRKVVDTINSFEESQVFFRGLTEWSGFKKIQVPFHVEERKGDVSKFSVRKLVSLAMDSVLSFSSKPLFFTLALGILFLLGAVVLGANSLVQYFRGQAVSGFTTVILLNLISGSFVLISLGIIGAYIARIYNEVKHRPRYIISEIKKRD